MRVPSENAQPSDGLAWTRLEEDFIREKFGLMTYAEIGEHIGRTYEAVKHRAYVLGLQKRQGCIANNARDNAYMERIRAELAEVGK